MEWMKIFTFIAVPFIAVCAVWIFWRIIHWLGGLGKSNITIVNCRCPHECQCRSEDEGR